MSDEKDQQNSQQTSAEGPDLEADREAMGQDLSSDDPQESGQDGHSDQVAELRDALLRTRAEMDNLEKRAQRELEKARKFMFEGVFRDLLPVIDSLDQGLEASGGEGQADEGLTLTRKLLLQTLQRHGLERIDPVGEAFDPQWHEAMSAQPTDEHPPQTVLVVMQKGYRLNDRLLRPARVVISQEVA